MGIGKIKSSRQRMINLMYLVLTALLALQVSSNIVDKFVFLNQSLEHSLDGAEMASSNALSTLRAKVDKEGNTADGLALVKRAEALKMKTAKLTGYIDKIKQKLINEAGGGINSKTGSVKNPKEETKVETYMIGSENEKSGEAYKLEKELNGYVEYLYKEFGDLKYVKKPANMENEGPFPLLAVGNQNNPLYENDAIQRNKDFAQANFGQTPVVAALAVLTQKQNEIIRYEQEVLKRLGIKDIGWLPKVKGLVAVASADANTIAEGESYTAKMYLTAAAANSDIKMYVNGSPVRIEDGFGLVNIPTQRAGEQEWTGEIKFKVRDKDTVLRFTKKYQVVKPVLLINNKNKFPLYKNCANDLETAVPALGASYSPVFSSDNGEVIPGSRVGDVTLIPTREGNCKLTVSSKGKVIGYQEFVVNPVPRPTVYLGNSSGTEVQLNRPIPASVPKVFIYAKPDETFKRTLPREANYKVEEMQVTLFRSGTGKIIKQFTSGVIDMRKFGTLKAGDGFFVNITKVRRMNSKGVSEVVRPLNNSITFFVK